MPAFAFRESDVQLAAAGFAKTRRPRRNGNQAGLHEDWHRWRAAVGDRREARSGRVPDVARDARLPIASHTGSGAAAMAQLDLLEAAQVAPASFIWYTRIGTRRVVSTPAWHGGAWVEFDGVSPSSVERHVALVQAMKRAGLLAHTLVSHDAGWYRVGEPGGGRFDRRHDLHVVRPRTRRSRLHRRGSPATARRQSSPRADVVVCTSDCCLSVCAVCALRSALTTHENCSEASLRGSRRAETLLHSARPFLDS